MEVACLNDRGQHGDDGLPWISTTSNTAAMSSPIRVFLFFHKAIRAELDHLYKDALAVEKGEDKEFQALFSRYEFLRVVYTQHSNAEDEVIFPALDSRVKNIAQTYSLEHKEESDLFDQMLVFLNLAVKEGLNASTKLRRDLICCTEAIQTTLYKHMAKEEEQVFPLLMECLSYEEHSELVWHFICSIPVNLMEIFLPWLASCLSEGERHEMIACVHYVVPKEDLLWKVVSSWLKGANISTRGTEVGNITHGTNAEINAGESGFSLERSISEETNSLLASKSVGLGQLPCDRKVHCLASGPSSNNNSEIPKRSICYPIDVLLFWHKAIRKELTKFSQEAKQIQSSSAGNLSKFCERLQFLAEVCIFHSAAEDKVIFPAIGQKAKQWICFEHEHKQEERQFNDIRRLLEVVQNEIGSLTSTEISSQLCRSAELILETIEGHLVDEETKVFPLARAYCGTEEQRSLVYQCLRVMPLKLLESVLPWLVASLSEEEAKIMLDHVWLAAPASDKALITLLLGWACKGQAQKIVRPTNYSCFCSEITRSTLSHTMSCCLNAECSPKCEMPSFISSLEKESAATEERPHKRSRDGTTVDKEEKTCLEGTGMQDCQIRKKCCVPGLGVGGSSLGFGAGTGRRSLQSKPSNPLQSCYLGSGLFCLGNEPGSPSSGAVPKPIDTIFQFHKAIRKDLKYLDDESAKLLNCDDVFLRHFTGRFHLLWGLYRAHSNAEDEIVFPALEAKEALHNVSHSYTIDHKHEEKLFKEIAKTLNQLFVLHGCLCAGDLEGSFVGLVSHEANDHPSDYLVLYQQNLAAKLQGMCKSVHVTLDQHVSREELELWPLFSLHFSIDEQEKIVGQIIGTTGAEVLQAMLPWVTTALSQEEQDAMMYTWRQATRNTMFDKWLRAWWRCSPSESPRSSVSDEDIPESGTPESLQLVADYLSKNRTDYNEGKDDKVDSPEETVNPASFENLGRGFDGDISKDHEGEPFPCGKHHSGMNMEKDTANEQVFKGKIEESTPKFKPGWQDIFRMNEKELEAAVRKVSGDTSLDPRRKAYLMQNLMTSRWIVAQQHPSRTLLASSSGEHEDIPGRCPSYINSDESSFGCEHYKRNCKIRAACCGILFPCRFCHDKVSDHTMNRQATQEMMCMKCLEVQPVSQYCATSSCEGFCMAKYFCSICKLFDDKRDIYHCPSCNLCRVGKGLGVDFFHCMTCNACMSTSLTSHKCREKGLESNCPICHDFLFTSHTPVKALTCGHFMHSACYRAYTYSHYTCPICSKSLGDMNVYFGMLDALLASEQLPDEYRDKEQDILCNDCEVKGRAPFHWLYHKCRKCGSYNTRAI